MLGNKEAQGSFSEIPVLGTIQPYFKELGAFNEFNASTK